MKIMEKLTESKFGKFEGNEITGLMYLKGGGECTGGGGINQGSEIRNGITFDIWSEYDADSIGADGAVTYTNYRTTTYERKGNQL
jgi:hypothetical protein